MLKSKILVSAFLTIGGVAAASTFAPVFAPVSPTQMGQEKASAHHKVLARSIGHWKGTMSTPDGTSFPCEEVVTAVGDLWTKSEFHSEMAPNVHFVGHGTYGYDSVKGEAVGTWIDNFSSHLSVTRGSFDLDAETVELKWKAPGEKRDGELFDYRSMTTLGENNTKIEFFMMVKDQEQPIFTIEMERQKADDTHGHDDHEMDHKRDDGDHKADEMKK